MSKRKRLLFVLASGHGISHWFQGTMSVCLPGIIADLGISYTQIGFLRSFQRVAVLLSAVGGGVATDFLSHRKALLIFSVLWPTLFFFLQGFSTTVTVLATLIFIQNLCGGFLWHAPARATIGEQFPDRMGFGLGVHTMGANVAQTLAPLIVGALLAWVSWRTAFKLTLIPGLLTAVMLMQLLPRLKRTANSMEGSYLRNFRADVVKNSGFLGVTVVAALRSVGESMLPVFLPLYLAAELKMGTATIGVYLAALTFVGTVGAPAIGCISDRWGRKSTIFLSLLLGSIFIALIPIAGSDTMLLPMVAMGGLAVFAVGPIIQACALEHTPSNLWGSAQSFMDIGRALLSLVFPLIGGAIADAYGLAYAFYLMGAVNLLGALIILAVPAPGPRHLRVGTPALAAARST